MRLDETNSLALTPCLYLILIITVFYQCFTSVLQINQLQWQAVRYNCMVLLPLISGFCCMEQYCTVDF